MLTFEVPCQLISAVFVPILLADNKEGAGHVLVPSKAMSSIAIAEAAV